MKEPDVLQLFFLVPVSRLEYRLPLQKNVQGLPMRCYQIKGRVIWRNQLYYNSFTATTERGPQLLLVDVLLLPMGRRETSRKMPQRLLICSMWGSRVFVRGWVVLFKNASKLSLNHRRYLCLNSPLPPKGITYCCCQALRENLGCYCTALLHP